MKKLIVLLLLYFFVAGCEEKSTEPILTNKTLETAISPLVCSFTKENEMNLWWEDNYDNETGYVIRLVFENGSSETITINSPNITHQKINLENVTQPIREILVSAIFPDNLSVRTVLALPEPGSNFFLTETTDNGCELNWNIGVGQFDYVLSVFQTDGSLFQSQNFNSGSGKFGIVHDPTRNLTYSLHGTLGDYNFSSEEINVERHKISGNGLYENFTGFSYVDEILPLSGNRAIIKSPDNLQVNHIERKRIEVLDSLVDLAIPHQLRKNMSLARGENDIFAVYKVGYRELSIIDGSDFSKIKDVYFDKNIEFVKILDDMVYIVNSDNNIFKSSIRNGVLSQAGSLTNSDNLFSGRADNRFYYTSNGGWINQTDLAGNELNKLNTGDPAISILAISPDDNTIAAVSSTTIRSIDCSDMSVIHELPLAENVYRLKFLTNDICVLQSPDLSFRFYNTKLNSFSMVYSNYSGSTPVMGNDFSWFYDSEANEFYTHTRENKVVKGELANDWLVMYAGD
ncbi:MAG: hypothetical protein SCALA702_03220 [Melioribacteraceae bacterium]|nr:MAG: hypothetical protein SCALA702_03220 [Melioribacteraceae bacterium]